MKVINDMISAVHRIDSTKAITETDSQSDFQPKTGVLFQLLPRPQVDHTVPSKF